MNIIYEPAASALSHFSSWLDMFSCFYKSDEKWERDRAADSYSIYRNK